MKLIILFISLFIISCDYKMENQTITDLGKKQIGNNIYLKRLTVSVAADITVDRIYLLVDKDDNLINTAVNIAEQQGKIVNTITIK